LNKSESKKRVKIIVEQYAHDHQRYKKNPPTEQDLQRNYILPMLQALNWNIYNLEKVRQEKFIGDIQPDIYLVDEAGNIVCIEVKPDFQKLFPETDLEKYTVERVKRLGTRVVWLTSFKESQLHIFAEKSKKRIVKNITSREYSARFDILWKYLSNDKEGIRTRAALKAHATRK